MRTEIGASCARNESTDSFLKGTLLSIDRRIRDPGSYLDSWNYLDEIDILQLKDGLEVLPQDSILSENTERTNIYVNDKDDILILSTALNGNAELFVTGDKELLGLRKTESMRIVSSREFRETPKTQP